MANLVYLVFVVFFSCACSNTSGKSYRAADFCYDEPECEPAKWEEACKDGKNQSPIDLKFNDSASDENSVLEVKPLVVNNLFQEGLPKFELKNNGHSAQINIIPNNNTAYITSRGRPTVFLEDILSQEHYLQQIHFHWGPNNQVGSEHTLNNQRSVLDYSFKINFQAIPGKSFPMEIHMVHYNGRYDNFSQAVASGHSDALAVLGIFVAVGGSDNPIFEPIIDDLEDIERYDASHLVDEELKISDFLPFSVNVNSTFVANFFTYRGSLTTPPCLEIVNWIVFQDPVYLSAEQIQKFRTINEPDGGHMWINYRPVQRKDESVSVTRRFRMTNGSTLPQLGSLMLFGAVILIASCKM